MNSYKFTPIHINLSKSKWIIFYFMSSAVCDCSVRFALCGVRCVVCSILIHAVCSSAALCGSARGCVQLSGSACGSVRLSGSARGSVRLSSSAAVCGSSGVRMCQTIRNESNNLKLN
jgi:hypothetical protein